MSDLLTIGEFSRLTHVSVKALRHYHDVGLLEPADVDPTSGYRYYATAQVPTAQLIRRFRDLDMPLEQVRTVLEAPDVALRDQAILAHLEDMEGQLEQTQATVASLRALLEGTASSIPVEFRSVGRMRSMAIRESVRWDDAETWLSASLQELYDVLSAARAERAGPDGALYTNEFFEAHSGEVVAFVPIVGQPEPSERAEVFEVPGGHFAVTVHHGLFSDLDQTYGALGTFVAERALGVEGPIRENYLVTEADTADPSQLRTEVCWPVSDQSPSGSH
jgi:DNA-binding transcriptional MerR regulator